MTADEKLAAILAAVQVDPGNRGLANLFHHFPHDFASACKSIAEQPAAMIEVVTGFFIQSCDPPAFETDGPLGTVFLIRSLAPLVPHIGALAEFGYDSALRAGLATAGFAAEEVNRRAVDPRAWWPGGTHIIAIERSGPAADGRRRTMRGREIIRSQESDGGFGSPRAPCSTIGIGDGGNEIGMGKLPHELVAANIPNGDLIHCRVPADHLIVAGVSNWGAYALAAGIFVLRGVQPPSDLFDPDHERATLEAMVKAGPLVDGVTGKPTATVDGLTWDEYVRPLIRIGEILG